MVVSRVSKPTGDWPNYQNKNYKINTLSSIIARIVVSHCPPTQGSDIGCQQKITPERAASAPKYLITKYQGLLSLSANYSVIIDTRWCLDELLKAAHIDHRDSLGHHQPPKLLAAAKVIASFNLTDKLNNQTRLQFSNRWLAKKQASAMFRIDPLKIDVPAITAMMSFECTKSHHILPIAVTDDSVEEVVQTSRFIKIGKIACKRTMLPQKNQTDFIKSEPINRYRQEVPVTKAIAGATTVKTCSSRYHQCWSTAAAAKPLMWVWCQWPAHRQNCGLATTICWQRASDIHLEPRRDIGKVRFRNRWVLHTVYEMPAGIMTVAARIKILGRLNVAEKRKPQDGRLKTRTPKGQETELRFVNTQPRWKMVMRVWPRSIEPQRETARLGGTWLCVWNVTAQTSGIILVTEQMVTTTLYSTLKQLATDEVNVAPLKTYWDGEFKF